MSTYGKSKLAWGILRRLALGSKQHFGNQGFVDPATTNIFRASGPIFGQVSNKWKVMSPSLIPSKFGYQSQLKQTRNYTSLLGNVVGRRSYSVDNFKQTPSSNLLALKSSDPKQQIFESIYWVVITGAVVATTLANADELASSHDGKTVPREYEERVREHGFEDYLKTTHRSETVLPATHPTREKVTRIAQNVFDALRRGLEDNKVWGGTVYALGVTKKSLNIDWEVFVVDDPRIDHVDCFEGGKIVVYTGVLDHPSKSDAEIAYNIAQEVTLAVARLDVEDIAMIWGNSLGTACIFACIARRPENLLLTIPFILITSELSGLVKHTSDFFGLLLTASAGYHPQDVVDITPFSINVQERVMAVYQKGLSSCGNRD